MGIRDQAEQVVKLGGHANAWAMAVSLEAQRLQSPRTRDEQFVDCYLLVLALRQVIRSAEAMHKAVGGDPQLKPARSIPR